MRSWLKAAVVAFTVAVAAEAVVRWVSYRAWSQPLEHFAPLKRRILGGASLSVLERSDVLGAPERRRAQLFDPVTHQPLGTARYDALPESAFRDSPRGPAKPGAIRIACVGDSVVFDGFPAALQALADERYGAGRVDVRNLGIPGATYATTVVLARRFLPVMSPHIVVAYSGRNDLVMETMRQRLLRREMLGQPELPLADYLVSPRSRGLWSYALAPADPSDPPLTSAARRWEEESAAMAPVDDLWRLSRLAWLMDATLVASTYATPDPARALPAKRYAYDLEIRYMFALLESQSRFHERIKAANEQVRLFSQASATPLADVARALSADDALFSDIVHETDEGRRRHASAALDALDPTIRRLISAGVPEPRPRTSPARPPSLATPERLPETDADGTCQQGPCGPDECYVPATRGRTGYSTSELAPLLQRAADAYGYPDVTVWYSDDGPPTPGATSPLCLERLEKDRRRQKACIEAGACPPVVYAADESDDLPASAPTRLDAEALCAFEGKRLPTDLEWELAARGPDGRVLPWNGLWTGPEANVCGAECPWAAPGSGTDGQDGPAPSGQSTGVGPFGHRDLAGNQWEWVYDCFRSDLHRVVRGEENVVAEPMPGCRWILRGGSWRSLPGILEKRTPEGAPDTEVRTRGVRCARDFGTRHRNIGDGASRAAPAQDGHWRL